MDRLCLRFDTKVKKRCGHIFRDYCWQEYFHDDGDDEGLNDCPVSSDIIVPEEKLRALIRGLTINVTKKFFLLLNE